MRMIAAVPAALLPSPAAVHAAAGPVAQRPAAMVAARIHSQGATTNAVVHVPSIPAAPCGLQSGLAQNIPRTFTAFEWPTEHSRSDARIRLITASLDRLRQFEKR